MLADNPLIGHAPVVSTKDKFIILLV